MAAALHIVKSTIKEFGTWTLYETYQSGLFVSKERVEEIVDDYLRRAGLDGVVRVSWDDSIVAPTMMHGRRLVMKGPYREHRIVPLLHHEIGTHLTRKLNNKRNKHLQPRAVSAQTALETEEGLASLNTSASQRRPVLFDAALNYVAVWVDGVGRRGDWRRVWASECGFAELNQRLKPLVDDENKRWTVCSRVKRGLRSTKVGGPWRRLRA